MVMQKHINKMLITSFVLNLRIVGNIWELSLFVETTT